MRRLVIILAILLSACEQRASGDENTVTVSNANSPLDGIVEATDWCLKYGKVPQHTSSDFRNGLDQQTYKCVSQ